MRISRNFIILGPVKLGVMHKKELSLADEVLKEVNYDPKLVDQSNQSFKASREFAEQIAPIIQTPRQVVSLVFSILIGFKPPIIIANILVVYIFHVHA